MDRRSFGRPDVSIVIRAYNEAGPLRRLLEVLSRQEFDGRIQLVVMDNGSSDKTPQVARAYGAMVTTLSQDEFSYPRSLNMGIEAAAAPIVICLVAHAYPDRQDWVARAVWHFRDPEVAGVFAYTKPHVDAPLWDKLLHGTSFAWCRVRGVVQMKRMQLGLFGATNIALRRELWEMRPFNEAYGAGGEDSEWAVWAMASGYKILRDPAFTVRHSHYLRTWSQFWKQVVVWLKTTKPRQFDQAELWFREKF